MVFRDGRTYPPTVPTHQKVFSKVVFITLNWGNQKRCSTGNESECFPQFNFRPFAQFGGDFIWSDNLNWCIEHQNEVSELLDIGIFFAYSVVYGYGRISYCGKNSKKQNKMWRRLTGQLPYIYVYTFIHISGEEAPKNAIICDCRATIFHTQAAHKLLLVFF